jgi:hypothetical protein
MWSQLNRPERENFPAIFSFSGDQFHQQFWCQSRAAFVQMFLMLSMATTFGKNVQKYGVQY